MTVCGILRQAPRTPHHPPMMGRRPATRQGSDRMEGVGKHLAASAARSPVQEREVTPSSKAFPSTQQDPGPIRSSNRAYPKCCSTAAMSP